MSYQTRYLQKASTADGAGTPEDSAGFATKQFVEVVESAGGTCTLSFKGSLDGLNWYVIGFQPIGNQATLTRTVTPLSVTANLKQTYQLLDPYPQVQAVQSSSAGGVSVTVKLFEVG